MMHFEKTKQNKITIEHEQGVLPVFENPEGYPDEEPDKIKLGPRRWFANRKTLTFTLQILVFSFSRREIGPRGRSPGFELVMYEGCPLLLHP